MFDFNNFLRQITEMNVSDIHLRVNEVPVVRKNGEIIKTNIPPLSRADMDAIVDQMFPEDKKYDIENIYNLDFLYELEDVSIFRVNYAKSKQNPMLVMRIVSCNPPSFEEKNIPKILKTICENKNGLVFVTGPTGSGKSTTLAAMLNYINKNFAKHIVTLEDPIEYMHKNMKSIFSQRQVGDDTESYQLGLKYALRQDPDIILLGEIRDKETAKLALSAAETGHLVFTTLHAKDSIQTISRLVNFFEPHERDQIRIQLANVLRATIAQKLLPMKNQQGRVPAYEILISTPAIKDYIEKDNLEDIYNLIKEGKYADMITMNFYLANLVENGFITKETALEASENSLELAQMFRGNYHGRARV